MNAIRAGLTACLGLLLAGCIGTSKPVFVHHYALTAAPRAVPSGRPPSAAHKALQIARIAAPSWLGGDRIYYRLDYLHNDRIAAYGRSAWVAPPARMLEPEIQNALAAQGRWKVVVGPATPANAARSLHIRLNDFSQVFKSPRASRGVLDAVATLIDNDDGDAVAQHHFHIEVAAPSANAEGGVKALNEASRQFITQLQRWLRVNSREPHRSADEPRGG